MPAPYAQGAPKFLDCRLHGPASGAELIMVEGDSALSSVAAVRDERTQAVLALQGKPLNAWAAIESRVAKHLPYQQLATALGLPLPTPSPIEWAVGGGVEGLRFERLALLFDPDADGIHIGALVLLYLQRWLQPLVTAGRVILLRAPMFELVSADGELHHAEHPAQCARLSAQLRDAAGGQAPQVRSIRGLASIAPALLRERCVDPVTRQSHAVDEADLQAVVATFCRPRPIAHSAVARAQT